MAACIEIEAGLREPPWPYVSSDYGLMRAEGRHALARAGDGQHGSRRRNGPGPLEP